MGNFCFVLGCPIFAVAALNFDFVAAKCIVRGPVATLSEIDDR